MNLLDKRKINFSPYYQDIVVMFHPQQAKDSFRRSYEDQIYHDVILLCRQCDHMLERTLAERKSENLSVQNKLILIEKQSNAKMLHQVLSYSSILRQELQSTKNRLIKEVQSNIALKKQALRIKDIKMFSKHAEIESRSRVLLTLLGNDTSQFSRCRKAVLDNADNHLLQSYNADISVTNVFKLENSYLSGQLQNSVATIGNGKIKGLFCVVPKDYFYAMCAFGLHIQNIFGKEVGEGTPIPGLFQMPWFCAPGKGKTRNSEKIATSHYFPNFNNPFVLKFSKQSISQHVNIENIVFQSAENYVYIALCRVLLCRVKIVAGPIGISDISAALEANEDAIYSTSMDEYVLLNPNHVLPEFLMEIKMNIKSKPKKSLEDNNCPPGSTTSSTSASVSPDTRSKTMQSIRELPTFLNVQSVLANNSTDTKIDTESSESYSSLRGSCIGDFMLANDERQARAKKDCDSEIRDIDNRTSLIQKQAIVLSIEDTIQSFKRQLIVACKKG